jgi:hypothetical protein
MRWTALTKIPLSYLFVLSVLLPLRFAAKNLKVYLTRCFVPPDVCGYLAELNYEKYTELQMG